LPFIDSIPFSTNSLPSMKYLLSVIVLFSSFQLAFAQNYPASTVRTFAHLQDACSIDSLETLYGNNKKIPEQLKLPVLLALSYYPELKDTRIIFKEASIKTTLNARPTLTSLLTRSPANRTYVIRVNNDTKKSAHTIDKVPFNAVVGLISHEFAHIAEYVEKSFWGVCNRGLHYLTSSSKAKFEKEIDKRTVKQGLGWQLHDWAYFILNESDATEAYIEFKRNTYLTPDEILELMLEEAFDISD
jgi:hypothetical protein